MTDLLTQLRWQDAVDVALIAIVVYWISLLIRGTRAVQMLIGLVILFGTYLLSQVLELYTLNWILDNFLTSILLVIVVLFQNDIRRALTEVGRNPFFGFKEQSMYGPMLEELTRATSRLADRRIGALIVLEREVGLNDYMEAGTTIDARLSKELVESIFVPAAPMHDGALVIRRGRVAAAGCILPLTTNPNVAKTLGTRHRAAIGITEETDAVVVVVSEEGGTASLVREGRITRDLDTGALRTALQQLFTHEMGHQTTQ
ncbi:MAG: TIGR00159 family protein [Deltaproteobacteria bacterium]|nr:TIGR00159 family protein [Deltaproteobacteria bacterium]